MRPLKIIYIDDEPDLLENFAALFEAPDIAITTFSNPEEALQRIPDLAPDLVVLDYRLPNTTGDLVAQKLPESLHKVLLTGELDVEVVANFRHIFKKPLKMAVFEKYIEEQVRSAAA